MMNSQQYEVTSTPPGNLVHGLAAGSVLALHHGGHVSVLAGRVWLTRAGDLEDHVLGPGESIDVRGSRATLVEAWGRNASASIAWRPRGVLERLREGMARALGRCWDLTHPATRVGIGSIAALAALFGGALLFGPVSDARTRALASLALPLLHNVATSDAGAAEESPAHGGDTRNGTRSVAQEARRRAPGAA